MLDVNVLRNRELIEAYSAQFGVDGSQVVVPEMVLFELTKHPDDWASTIVRSLRHLARCPESVLLARSSKPLGLAEEAKGRPTTTFISPELTAAFRAVLLDAGERSELQGFLDAVRRQRPSLEHERHAVDSRDTMLTLNELGRASLPRDLVARVGRDLAEGNRGSFRDFLRRELLITQQRDAHVRRGVSEKAADALLLAPSVSYLFALAVGVIGLEWVFRGGVQGAAAGRIANDVLDIEYILAGLWVGRLVSDDAGVRHRFEDLKAIGASAWPSHADWFARATAVSGE